MFNKIRLWKKNPVSSNVQDRISALKMRKIPEHVAIIMDGRKDHGQESLAIMKE